MTEEEMENYKKSFYNPEFTPLEFVSLLAWMFIKNEIYSFKADLIESYIIRCKDNKLYEELLKEMKIRSNGIHRYSIQFQEAISTAKYWRILYSVSPEKDSTVFIEKNHEVSLSSVKKVYVEEMKHFMDFLLVDDAFTMQLKKIEK